MEHFHDIRVAIAKGRILEQLVPRWTKAHLPWPIEPESRQLWFSGDDAGPGAMIVRGPDVPTLVARGAADLGIVGTDLLVERGIQGVLEVGDLDLAECRVVLAGTSGKRPDGPFRVASKYQKITRDYLDRNHFQADIVRLSGSLELAPLIGLAAYIVDIVETGETLRQHRLIEIETIMPSHACLIANPAHWRAKPEVVTIRDRLVQHLA
ncbi:MAG: ATP phosphoribosyltransferase [Firmicutes bacterium]|jgi:ATP phosphoribosyltransferase|nr:ATP phosphoribosyltransferase [Bacillota bacterium]